MSRKTSYAILGTGALGGLYGGMLANSGVGDVHFLLRSDFQQVKSAGLRVESIGGDFLLTSPQVYQSPADMPKVDVAIVCWKTTANDALPEALAAVCGPRTLVLVLQNGYQIEEDAARIVGAENVLGGCCFLCSNKIGPGHIRHIDYGRIAFGEYSPKLAGSITPRMQQLADEFRQAGIDMQPAEDLQTVRWRKLVWNIPYNGLSVILQADTRAIMDSPAASALTESLMRDVQGAAAACGSAVEDEHIQKMLGDTRKMVPYDSSMLLDYRAGRPIEVEAIFGNPIRAALKAGYRSTKIEVLYEQLRFLGERQTRNLTPVT
ncbi:putative 2-dehydropantoate 2-reductase [Aureliella helgolandensis]|uniref:2-dehydropantoate 2-reductase n=1 Tax=Aureliella helgolandensis TaxID=2527968 RepID=A0A518G3J1_9BACT|nr:putative 2-dehydropantoate 2-reductase [Aureliella helgolandensis]QDV23163.1 2-dehydropantoate 2-reductase [Aureliella helgolandensis]